MTWITGVNMREFAYYGTKATPHTTEGLQTMQLDVLESLEAKVVRFYAACRLLTAQECVDRVNTALDLLDSKGMKAVICLSDSLGSNFYVSGDEEFHAGPLGHLVKSYWHSMAYNNHFIPFTKLLADQIGGHPAIFMWELGNEYAVHPQPANEEDGRAFMRFASETSKIIRAASPNTLVSTGLVGAHHVAPSGQAHRYGVELYRLPTIDAISIHYYADDNEKHNSGREFSVSEQVGKPLYVGEFGAPHGFNDRPKYYSEQLKEWEQAAALMALPWAFDASKVDVGISDLKSFGGRFPDFDDIADALKSFGVATFPVVTPPTSPQPSGTTKYLTYKVISPVGLRVRSKPSLAPGTLIPDKFLSKGDKIDVIAKISEAADGYVWRQHDFGWSAEKTEDGSEVYLELIDPDPAGSLDVEDIDNDTFESDETIKFRVVSPEGVRIRTQPSTEPRTLTGQGLSFGEVIDVTVNSRTESDGYVWRHFDRGWSAEKSIEGQEVLMVPADQVEADKLFTDLPLVGELKWVQYFGNTTFAFTDGKDLNYDGYSQGLHGGLDLGASPGTTVRACIQGAKCDLVSDKHKFPPWRVDLVIGPYRIIYGHLQNPNFDLKDTFVNTNAELGEVSVEEEHIHIEIRKDGQTLHNPLEFLPTSVVNSIFAKEPPAGQFQNVDKHGNSFTKWQDPLDQPDISIGGPVVGPRE